VKTRQSRSPDGTMTTSAMSATSTTTATCYLTDRATFMINLRGSQHLPAGMREPADTHPKVADAAGVRRAERDLGEEVKGCGATDPEMSHSAGARRRADCLLK